MRNNTHRLIEHPDAPRRLRIRNLRRARYKLLHFFEKRARDRVVALQCCGYVVR
jgi:hypothetical protein